MKTALAFQLFASAATAKETTAIDFSEAEDKDLLAHQALIDRLSQCTSVSIQNVGTGAFLTQLESMMMPRCVSVSVKKPGFKADEQDNEAVAAVSQRFNLQPTADRTVRIEASGSALGLHANRGDTRVGCSLQTRDPYTTQPLHTSSNWALFRSKEITESQLSPDDLLASEWYLTAQFVAETKARVAVYDE